MAGLTPDYKSVRITKVNGRPVRTVKEYKQIAHDQKSFQISVLPPNNQAGTQIFQQAINPTSMMPTSSALPLPNPQQQRFAQPKQQPPKPAAHSMPGPAQWKPAAPAPRIAPSVASVNTGWIPNAAFPPTPQMAPRPQYTHMLPTQSAYAPAPSTIGAASITGAPSYTAPMYPTNALQPFQPPRQP